MTAPAGYLVWVKTLKGLYTPKKFHPDFMYLVHTGTKRIPLTAAEWGMSLDVLAQKYPLLGKQMKKVYVAALYSSRLGAAQAACAQLEAAGYECTSRWISQGEEGMTLSQAAQMDLEDVRRADYVMLLTLPYGSLYKGGGRHVEFGYALALGKQMLVVGDFETIFCHLPNVQVYPTVGAAIHYMEK